MSKFDVYEVQPGWKIGQEQMGSKRKFWYSEPNAPQDRWLFKFPKASGEHWAEKIAAEVAKELDIRHAEVELAVLEGQQGSAAKSFVNTNDGWSLLHGNQLLFHSVSGYDREMKFHQNKHTLKNIWAALDKVFKKREDSEKYKIELATYLILDAVIGNTDRHHENWGLMIKKELHREWRGSLAPSFDHASSLGRELKDSKRCKLIEEDEVGRYVENGHGGVYWSESESRGPSPLELVRHAYNQHPNIFRQGLEKVENLNEKSLQNILNSITEDWMSEIAKAFAFKLMRYNIEELGKVL